MDDFMFLLLDESFRVQFGHILNIFKVSSICPIVIIY